jgi:hypothetical protein
MQNNQKTNKSYFFNTAHLQVLLMRFFPYLSGLLFASLLLIFFSMNFFERKKVLAETIQEDLQEIIRDLIDIDTNCNILSIMKNNCVVDFLTIKAFSGSMLSELNLAYPERWKGPYRKTNHLIQGRFYEITKLKDCYALVPGAGVKLPGKKIMGKDIICDETVEAKTLFDEGGLLRHKKYYLGYPLPFVIGDWDSVLSKDLSLKKIEDVLKQLHEAISFSKRDEIEQETFIA